MNRGRIVNTVGASVTDDLLAPYRRLALRVISLAVRDLITPSHSTCERDAARAFLSGSGILTHWCTLAEVDPEAIRQQMRGLVKADFTVHLQRRR